MVWLEMRGSPTRILEDQWPWSIWYRVTSKDGAGWKREGGRERHGGEIFDRRGKRGRGGGDQRGLWGKQRWWRGKGRLRSLRGGDWWESESEERTAERGGEQTWRGRGRGEGERGETGKRRQNVRNDRRYRSSCSSSKEPRALRIQGRYFIGGDETKTEAAWRSRKLHWAKDPRWDLRGNIWRSHRGCCCTRKANSVAFFLLLHLARWHIRQPCAG